MKLSQDGLLFRSRSGAPRNRSHHAAPGELPGARVRTVDDPGAQAQGSVAATAGRGRLLPILAGLFVSPELLPPEFPLFFLPT